MTESLFRFGQPDAHRRRKALVDVVDIDDDEKPKTLAQIKRASNHQRYAVELPPGCERPEIVNLVSTFKFLTVDLDMESIVRKFPAIGYDRSSFVAAKIRYNKPLALVFNGQIAVCPGSKSPHEARITMFKIIRLLLSMGVVVECSEFVIENVVCSIYYKYPIDIRRLHNDPRHKSYTRFKDDAFPAVTYSIPHTSITANVFDTGRVVITGTKSYDETCRVYVHLRQAVLEPYAKRSVVIGAMSARACRSANKRMHSTMQQDCASIASQQTLRPDGELASSHLSDRMHVSTPLTTRAISTPLVNVKTPASNVGVVQLQLISRQFASHTLECPWVKFYSDTNFLTTCLNDLHVAVADERLAESACAMHVDAGCTNVENVRAGDGELLNYYVAQLHAYLRRDDEAPERPSVGDQRLFTYDNVFDVETQFRLDTRNCDRTSFDRRFFFDALQWTT